MLKQNPAVKEVVQAALALHVAKQRKKAAKQKVKHAANLRKKVKEGNSPIFIKDNKGAYGTLFCFISLPTFKQICTFRFQNK